MSERRRHQFDLLDAFRGLAIVAVMVLHACERGIESGDTYFHAYIWPLVLHGYLGVQLFFVISGYCITVAVYSSYGKPKALQTFLIRRARRIFPPYWCSIVLVVMLGLLTVAFMHKSWSSIFPMTLYDWILNTVLLQGPLGAPDVNMVYWSLSIELQFYCVMAICLVSRRWAEVYLVAVSFISLWLLSFGHVALSGSVLNYWPEFACGIAAFYFITKENRHPLTPWLLLSSVAGTGLILACNSTSWIAADGRLLLPWKLAFCLSCTGILVACHAWDKWLSSLAWISPLTSLGVLSYSLYLIHVPIGTRVFNLGERLTSLDGPLWLLYAGIAIFLELLAGIVFYQCCERPWLNSRPLAGSQSDSPNIVPKAAQSVDA